MSIFMALSLISVEYASVEVLLLLVDKEWRREGRGRGGGGAL